MYSLLRPALFGLDPERAHQQTLRLLDLAYHTGMCRLLWPQPKPLVTRAFGLAFPNPVGLAAGLDKNGEHIDALFALGFGFIEIGTVTPRPQAGNPKPRLFRMRRHGALINRMGFNNAGVDALVRNVERSKRRGILGINIGKNKDTPNENAADDYLLCMQRVYGLADYLVVNISSPNTQGLRELQNEDALRQLLGALREQQERLGVMHGKRVPMLIKIAPDLDEAQIDSIALVLNEAHVDGVIATNTTVDRAMVLSDPRAHESGGMSGQPLYGRSTRVLRRLRARLDEHITLIGVGGVMSAADAAGKVAAGAALIQLYSGLVYSGPTLIRETVDAIRRRREGPSR
ncbi:MAG: quinone-dependent dihydroorotate dehydrogenase [Xanthomonadaceae bacterium]|nr:quinone-dependent dihydroorotate dehydrogenase [Xanthomonadaceae bacterium]MDP2186961.1 quinone-dependent dihydroorotate dehydrogenase [Xanthomonadales bacterium]MDZ4116736.1 quinone-dependent dihydroorotate dehydrogenase [Xanthomonadaceae bacterium]MDZ4379398.1 quinone-dependent dihydroorotate dehydrogenase [Xanthomonadaceae bacterium]